MSSSQTVNLLNGDSERGPTSAARHSTVWNDNFDREVQASLSSLVRLLRATGLGFRLFKHCRLKFACSPLVSSSSFLSRAQGEELKAKEDKQEQDVDKEEEKEEEKEGVRPTRGLQRCSCMAQERKLLLKLEDSVAQLF